MADATEKICASCKAVFTCGPTQTDERCWCENLPLVPLVAGECKDCFCPECLAQAIAEVTTRAIKPAAVSTGVGSMQELREGEDYYVDGAAIVFTTRYHLRRGYCCESGCRHCPYRNPGKAGVESRDH